MAPIVCLIVVGQAAVAQMEDTQQASYLGLRVQPVESAYGRALALVAREGALVTAVAPDSPAEQGGLLPGDVIVRFADSAIATVRELELACRRVPVGRSCRCEVLRGSAGISFTVTPGPQPAPPAGQTIDLGLRGTSAGTPEAIQLGVGSAAGMVLSATVAEGAAAQAGLRSGDLVVELGGLPITTFEDFQAAMFRLPAGSQQRVAFVRGDQRLEAFIALQIVPRLDAPRSFTHASGGYRLVSLPPAWFAFPRSQEGVDLPRQYDLIVSPTGAYQLRCFKGIWLASQPDAALDEFVREKLAETPEAQRGRSELGGAAAAWVAYRLPDRPCMLYRLAFVHQELRYVVNITAPVLCDPEELPPPVAWMFQSMEFPQPVDNAGSSRQPPAGDQPNDAAAEDSSRSPVSTPVPANWTVVSLDEIRLRVPPDWTAVASTVTGEGRWLRGDEENFDASFTVVRHLSFEDLGSEMTVERREEMRIADLPAQVYYGKFADSGRSGQGMMVFAGSPARSGGTVAFCCHAAEHKWADLQPLFEQMLKSIETSDDAGGKPVGLNRQ